VNIKELLSLKELKLLKSSVPFEINNVCYNSKMVKKNDLFVAIQGFKSDGHKFISTAVENGAASIVLENRKYIPNDDNLWLFLTDDSRCALSAISSQYFGNPVDSFFSIGVTGTNGKTSVTYYLYDYFFNFKRRLAGLVGTIKYLINDAEYPSSNTTPESRELQELFYNMKKNHVKYLISEVSSHALELKRVYGIKFDVAVFTNLTRDHLDFHKTMENYYRAKKTLFTQNLKNGGLSIINMDDKYGKRLSREITDSFSISLRNKNADFYADNISLTTSTTSFLLTFKSEHKIVVKSRLLGVFNVYNMLTVFAVLYLMGEEIEDIVDFLKIVEPVKGRFQSIKTINNIHIIIDYAHTPDALENILKLVSRLKKGRIITVFGAGGDRDVGKRPMMGKIASDYSDYVIITNDNPRGEDPEKIAEDIINGINIDCKVLLDRKTAIENAIERTKPEDWIVLAGKGHEDYQIIGSRKIHFSDEETVLDFLKKKKLYLQPLTKYVQ